MIATSVMFQMVGEVNKDGSLAGGDVSRRAGRCVTCPAYTTGKSHSDHILCPQLKPERNPNG